MLNIIIKIWKLIPGVVGFVQQILPPIKEVAVIAIRIVDIFTMKDGVADEIIDKINAIYDKVYGWVEIVKDYMLGL